MKHRGKAAQAGRRVLGRSLVGILLVGGLLALVAQLVGGYGLAALLWVAALWLLFALGCLWFFRDPDPTTDAPPEAYLAPAHGVVDIIDETTETEFIGGPCRRISIFLSVFDVHTQNAPVAGSVIHQQHHPGEFLNALNLASAARNENLMVGFENDAVPGEKVGVRLIAGIIARRIVPWVALGDRVSQGERIGLIQFGSRVNLYLPLSVRLTVGLRQRVIGGVTVVATRAVSS